MPKEYGPEVIPIVLEEKKLRKVRLSRNMFIVDPHTF